MSISNCKLEKHENWYKDVPKMKCLILGSFPPHKSKWDYPFYYPNSSNRFWDILAKIAKKDLTAKDEAKAVKERYEIMRLLNVGVQDMGLEIDILSIIKKHNELEKILLPGYSAPNSTTKSFLKYLDSENIPYDVKDIKANTEFFINVFNRKIKCVILNSTSRRAAGVKEEELLKQFKRHLLPLYTH